MDTSSLAVVDDGGGVNTGCSSGAVGRGLLPLTRLIQCHLGFEGCGVFLSSVAPGCVEQWSLERRGGLPDCADGTLAGRVSAEFCEFVCDRLA